MAMRSLQKVRDQRLLRQREGSSGFTLLEVVITLTILMTLVFAVARLMRSSFDVREGLAQDAKVTQRVNTAMQRLAHDLAHAFLLSSKDQIRTMGQRRTLFKIEKAGKSDTLTMTYMGHQGTKANAKESDLSYVVYEVRQSEKFAHRSHLYRGELPRVPEEVWKYKENPPMRIIAENIESVRLDAWRGDDWLKGNWDSSQGEGDNSLPPIVRVTIRAWVEDPIEGVEPEAGDEVLVQYSTVVYLPYSSDFNDLKDPLSTFKLL